MKITKLDAARRQLRAAIRLWFADDDPVAIYALTYAAHEVVYTLSKRGGVGRGLVFDTPALKPDAQRRVIRGIKDWGNFLKHADKDPDGQIAFNPETTDLLLLATAHALRLLTAEVGAEEAAYVFWFAAKDPDAFDQLHNPEFHAIIRRDFKSKGEFWSYMREHWGTKIRLERSTDRSVGYRES